MPPPVDYFEEESTEDVDSSVMITYKEYHILNKKLDNLLTHTNTFSTTNFDNLITTHKTLMQNLTSENAKIF